MSQAPTKIRVNKANKGPVPESQVDIMKIIDEEKHMAELKAKIEANPITVDDTSPIAHLGEYIEDPYTIIESYFRGQHLDRLVRHQVESYNHFINFQITRTIEMFNPVNIRSENDFVAENGQYFL